MRFEWDEDKNRENLDKHQVSFQEAQKAFLDTHRIILKDERHSQVEDRYFCIGKIADEVATVRFTIRGEKIRIFGAGYWREGKKLYEK
ncbi:MAG: BrnT family toxin [Spirochaetes bacterium]|nr:MAG: BrnT family toxin [Spirochaetota bacterium]